MDVEIFGVLMGGVMIAMSKLKLVMKKLGHPISPENKKYWAGGLALVVCLVYFDRSGALEWANWIKIASLSIMVVGGAMLGHKLQKGDKYNRNRGLNKD